MKATEAISVICHPNEKQTKERIAALEAATKPPYVLQYSADVPGDLQLKANGQIVNVEVKEISDLWASKQGHLGDQAAYLIADGHPAFVAVLGSLDEVLMACPWVSSEGGKAGRRTWDTRNQDMNSERALDACLGGLNLPMFYLSSMHSISYKYILSKAKAWLFDPNLAQWFSRFPVDVLAYRVLAAIPTIGDANAKGLLLEWGSIQNIANAPMQALADTKVNGRRLGPSKATTIQVALCGGPVMKEDIHRQGVTA
jgi:hypothetical protein